MIGQDKLLSALKCLQTRFAKISMAARHRRYSKLGCKPKLIMRKDHVCLRIHKESTKHKEPHFHIEFKKIYSAAYSIMNFTMLAGKIPKQYEKTMLSWAKQNKSLLLKEWKLLSDHARVVKSLN